MSPKRILQRASRLAEKVFRRARTRAPMRSLEEWEESHAPLVRRAVGRVKPHLPQGGLFLDIGANVGMFSRFLREERPDARGILFEPVQKYADICRERFADDPNIRVVHAALGDENGERTIYKPAHNYGGNSLVKEIMFARGPESFVRPETVIEEETITLRRVCDWLDEEGIDHVDVVKSDTEGFDYAVLDGLRPWIEATGCHPVVLAEVLKEAYHPLIDRQRAALESFFALGYGRVEVDDELDWIVGDVLLLPGSNAARALPSGE